ncbi:MAG: lipoyl(octanoyl) transferase LipB [Rickettsiales bacterium]
MVKWKYSNNLVNYSDALNYMDAKVKNIHTKKDSETIWFLEHPDIYTAGVSAKPADLLDKNINLIATGRGGEITYHGPEMRIIYLMLDLKKRNLCDIKQYIKNLEKWIINSLAQINIKACNIPGKIGIWVPDQANQLKYNKIAAIGVRIRKWVTFHGIAVNYNPDLAKFAKIIPCGINDSNFGITKIKDLNPQISKDDFDQILKREFAKIFK